MFAASAARSNAADPLSALALGDHPEPRAPDGWTVVTVCAAALNHHDLWTLRGVGVRPSRLPQILGSDGAGIDDQGRDVIIHPVIGDASIAGDETLDPARIIVGEGCDGTFAERIAVPRANLIPKPPELTYAEAACLPGAWLTAYRMLIEKAGAAPGATILVQGAGGGVATALIMLGTVTGYRVWVTSRSGARRDRALALGADRAFAPGERLPERVDAVMETVGAATWDHSLRSVRSGGRIVIAGATSGSAPPAGLDHVFFRQISVLGSTLGTRAQLANLTRLCVTTGVRPLIDREMPLTEARKGFVALRDGELFGKCVFTM